MALDETSHDHGRHRRARDAGVLPIRVAGDAEQQVACSCRRQSTSQVEGEVPRLAYFGGR